MAGGDLSSFMRDRILKGEMLTEPQVKNISRQICEAVQVRIIVAYYRALL